MTRTHYITIIAGLTLIALGSLPFGKNYITPAALLTIILLCLAAFLHYGPEDSQK